MDPHLIKPADHSAHTRSELLDYICSVLIDGGVAVLPAEGLYGLHALASPAGIAALHKIKLSPPGRPFITLISHPDKLDLYARPAQRIVTSLIKEAWPGPVTMLLPARDDLDADLSHKGVIALRCPGSSLLRDLASLLPGPLLSTSANQSGETPPASLTQLADKIKTAADLIVDGGELSGYGSTLISFDTTGKVIVNRPGPWLPQQS